MEYVIELTAGAEVTFPAADVYSFFVGDGQVQVFARDPIRTLFYADRGDWTRWYLREVTP